MKLLEQYLQYHTLGIYQKTNNKTSFISWIHNELIKDRGNIRASDLWYLAN